MGMKKYRWFAHYNKPLSQRKGKVMWSLHFKGECHFSEEIQFVVKSMITKVNKRQPHAVIQGYANEIVITRKAITVIER